MVKSSAWVSAQLAIARVQVDDEGLRRKDMTHDGRPFRSGRGTPRGRSHIRIQGGPEAGGKLPPPHSSNRGGCSTRVASSNVRSSLRRTKRYQAMCEAWLRLVCAYVWLPEPGDVAVDDDRRTDMRAIAPSYLLDLVLRGPLALSHRPHRSRSGIVSETERRGRKVGGASAGMSDGGVGLRSTHRKAVGVG